MTHANSPFKFLDSYQKEDGSIFFGREKETEALYNALSGVKHLIVYGPSGAGKTSLVECGLRNQFSDADWFALTIRRGTNLTASVFEQINDSLYEKIDLENQTFSLEFGEAIEALFAERYQPVYLLFDQFEELIIQGSEEEKKDFFTRLNQLIRYRVPCRVLLIMREEFIGHLSEFETLCPSIFQHRYRLEKMRRENVREVIYNILNTPFYQSAFQVEQSELLSDAILSKLPDNKREIELTHVQVFLSELWDRANTQVAGKNIPVLHPKLIQKQDDLESVLDSFLKKQLGELAGTYGEKVPLELLATMISERHTKLQLSEKDIQQDLDNKKVYLQKPLKNLLKDIEERRIIRTIRAGDQTQYEISHDVLAIVVGQNLTEEMKLREKAGEIYRVYEERQGYFAQEDLDYLRPFRSYLDYPLQLENRIQESEKYLKEEQQRELTKTQKRLRTVRGLLLIAVIAFLIATGGVWYAVLQQRATQKAQNQLGEQVIQTYSESVKALRNEGKYSDALKLLNTADTLVSNNTLKFDLVLLADTLQSISNFVRLADSLIIADTLMLPVALRQYEAAFQLSRDSYLEFKMQQTKENITQQFYNFKQRGLTIFRYSGCKHAKPLLQSAYVLNPNDDQINQALKQCN